MTLKDRIKLAIENVSSVEDFLEVLIKERDLVYDIGESVRWTSEKKINKKLFMKNYPFQSYILHNSFCNTGEKYIDFRVQFQNSEYIHGFEAGKTLEMMGCNLYCGGWAGYYYGNHRLVISEFPIINRAQTIKKLKS